VWRWRVQAATAAMKVEATMQRAGVQGDMWVQGSVRGSVFVRDAAAAAALENTVARRRTAAAVTLQVTLRALAG
jgi:hypothetical protein